MKITVAHGPAPSTPVLQLVFALVLALFVLHPRAGFSREQQTLRDHVPSAVKALKPAGLMPAAQTLSLAIGLPLRNREALTNLLQDLYNPSSPLYHQFLTPEQFTERFGPSEADYESVVAFVKAHGFSVSGRHPNRVVLDVKGSVADVERMLHLKMQVYQHPRDGRIFYAPDTEPSIDLGVAIMDISGLSDYQLPKPRVRVSARTQDAADAAPRAGSGPGNTYAGNDFRAAYAPGVTLTGAGQTLGLLQFDGYYAADITAYQTLIGLTNGPTLQNVLLDGFNGKPTTGANSGNVEVSLDIEMAIAMAPGLSKIIVYEAGPYGTPNDILSRMASDNLAKTIGCSWGWSGGPSGTTDQLFQQMIAQGQSFFSASGDGDAFPAGTIDNSSQPNMPSDNPYITIVGGTTLTTGTGASYGSETVWNWGNGTGSSGGTSTYYSIPTWQQGISMASNQGSTAYRNIPDVALTADNVYVLYGNGSSTTVGGTSCAAPLWAGLAALINQQAATNGVGNVGFLNPALYNIAKSGNYSTAFHDVTTGNNFSTNSPAAFSAVAGYDLCTGWGTPKAAGLINLLAGPPAPFIVSNSLALTTESCPSGALDPGETVTVTLGLRNTGGSATTNLVATLVAAGGVNSPGAAQTYGALAPGGATVTRPFAFTASGVCGGTVTATLLLQDGGASLGSATFVMPLGSLVVATNFQERFDSVTAPALPSGWTSTATGAESPWATSTSSSDTAPNAAFVPDAGNIGLSELVSPPVQVTGTAAQLIFRNNYNLEAPVSSTDGYDGGVLEIKIGTGSFTDILTAGGSFVSGGYNRTINATYSNPLGGRRAWSSTSSGYVSTIVNLPSNATGQTVQFKWRCGTDDGVTGGGWRIDGIYVSSGSYTCCTSATDLALLQSASPVPAAVGQNLAYTLTVTNRGPIPASSVTVTDTLPANVTFVAASAPGVRTGSQVTWDLGALPSGSSTNLTITAKPGSVGSLTNFAFVSSTTVDTVPANNAATNIVAVYAPPTILVAPTNQAALTGSSVSFDVSASGTAPLSYQWQFDSSPLPGATVGSLLLTNLQAGTAGSYSVVVSNLVGVVTSAPAILTILSPSHILAQPQSRTVPQGGGVTFEISAAGTGPLGYQWLFEGGTISSATGSILALTNVQLSQAGNYSVIVTNIANAVTSSVANLRVLQTPDLAAVTKGGSEAGVSFLSVSGLVYTLQYKTSLEETNWTSLPPPAIGNGEALQLYDTNAPAVSRFYRVLCE